MLRKFILRTWQKKKEFENRYKNVFTLVYSFVLTWMNINLKFYV